VTVGGNLYAGAVPDGIHMMPGLRPPSSSGLGRRPFTAVARVRIPLGVRRALVLRPTPRAEVRAPGPVAQLVSASPCHGEGRGFESRRGRVSALPVIR
jgi:hypothetical protein